MIEYCDLHAYSPVNITCRNCVLTVQKTCVSFNLVLAGFVRLGAGFFAGQADYFGHVPNLAARVSALAAPGQILLECSPGFDNKVSWIKEGSVGLLTTKDGGPIELKGLGHYYLKGFDDNTKLIYQVQCLLGCQDIASS